MEELFDLSPEEINDFKDRNKEEENDAVEAIIPPPDIVAFTEQRSCADIFRMYEKKQLDINPDFQRGEVWTNRSQTLFIDSLMKQLPIPSMCISLDIKTQNRLVIDGLQRITSIVKFLDETNDWKLANTSDADDRISGKKVSEIRMAHSDIYDRIENVTIPITVIRCDYENQNHMQYLFQIFYRLNTGGNKLYNQEIRNCIYQGSFNNLLKELARDNQWLKFANVTTEKVDKSRFINEEKILRFFAFYDTYMTYNGKLASFLNDYMGKCARMPKKSIEEYKSLFLSTLEIANKLQEKPDSKNVTDAILVGIAKNKDCLLAKTDNEINDIFLKIKSLPEFSPEELKEGLGATEKVRNRIGKSIKLFSCD